MRVKEQTGIDLDPTAITRIEKGQRGIALGEACAIASALGVALPDMLKTSMSRRVDRLELEVALIENELSAARATVDLAQERERSLQAKLAETRATLASLQLEAGVGDPALRARGPRSEEYGLPDYPGSRYAAPWPAPYPGGEADRHRGDP